VAALCVLEFLPLFELALVLVRLDHVASVIVGANHDIMWPTVELRMSDEDLHKN
jgi:hypothetical protein